VIRGKRLIVVDDSIVRGNTQRALVRMLREAGAVEVHVRIASPPVKWPCFYGIDFATPAELIANAPGTQTGDGEMLEAVRQAIGADTLGYISQQGMIAATEQPASRLCCACFDGDYPIELPTDTALGKNVVENMLAAVQAGSDNFSALSRP
jgi:amidophosphoribosyltransferase